MNEQAFLFYRGLKKKIGPALNKDIVEFELIEEYHWLPQEIRKIPYITLQKLLILRQSKNRALQEKESVEQLKREMNKIQNPKRR